MPYISTEQVKEIRNNLKKEFPKMRFSVSRINHNCVNVVILSAPFQMLLETERNHIQVNQYYIKETYKNEPILIHILEKINKIVSANHIELYHDADYGYVPNYYYNISIGTFLKPFVVK